MFQYKIKSLNKSLNPRSPKKMKRKQAYGYQRRKVGGRESKLGVGE